MSVPVYALYCSEIPGREAVLRAHLKERGVEATLWRGFHGTTWGFETSKEYDPGKRLPPGHVGLNAGSYMMWQHALLQGDGLPGSELMIFFEDDVELPVDFHEQVRAVRRDLFYTFPDWDLVFIGTCGTEPAIWHKVTERIGGPDSRLCRLCNPFGTHAMMIRRRAIPVLLEHMRAAERNLDQQLWQRVLQPGYLKWCAVLPSIVNQRTYDNKGVGTPEWSPSTLRPEEMPNLPAPDPETVTGDLPGRPSAETTAATLAVISPFSCLYRGEALEDHGRAMTKRGPVPLSECARLNRTCHSKKGIGVVIDQTGDEAVSCETCPHRLEMAPSIHRERLPLPEGHFNPSMIMWQGRLIMATRDSWGHSKVALWELKNDKPDWTGAWTCKPIGSHKTQHPLAPRLEDPRLFIAPNPATGRRHLHASFSLPDGYPPKVVKVGYVRFAEDLSGIEETVVMDSPHGNLYEKNWQCISVEDELRWVYSFKPEHVVMGRTQNWITPNPLPWTGGVIRGGATPVFVPDYKYCISHCNDVMDAVCNGAKSAAFGIDVPLVKQDCHYHFFHGVLKRPEGNVYTIGCNVFEARPPYRVLRQTPTPLMWPDLPAPDESVVKRYVLFPGGAVPHAGAWHIATGVDDTHCRVIRIPFEQVEAALSDGGSDRNVSSIRDTHIAHGVTAEEFK